MTIQFLTKFLDDKIKENKNFIKITFYELRIKNGLSEKEVSEFLKLSKIRLENMQYQVCFTGAKFYNNNKENAVQAQDYMIAIKEGNN